MSEQTLRKTLAAWGRRGKDRSRRNPADHAARVARYAERLAAGRDPLTGRALSPEELAEVQGLPQPTREAAEAAESGSE